MITLKWAAIIALAAPIACVCAGPAAAQEIIDTSAQGTAAGEFLAEWDSDDQPGLAVAVVHNGATVLQKGMGLANLEHGIAISDKTAFHAASISKQLTAFAILTLVDDGKLHLDDDVRLLLPELEHLPSPVKVGQLLDHTGGLREVGTLMLMAGWLPDDIVTQQQQYSLITAQNGFNFSPGSEIEYSNTGYALLARIVESVAQRPFDEHLRETVFEPLGMEDTLVQADRSAIISNVASSYNVTRRGNSRSNLNREIVGSTGVITTAPDLMKWAMNFSRRTVGTDRVFALMEERGMTNTGAPSPFARGQEQRDYNGLMTWSHGGRIAGFRSFLLRVPAEEFAVVLLSNRSDFDPARVGFGLADIYLADSESFRKAAPSEWSPATSAEIDSYAGYYELFPGAIFDISNADGELQFSPFGSGQQLLLEQSGKGEFVLNSAAGISLKFENDISEPAQEVKYVLGLNGELVAHRTEVKPLNDKLPDLSEFTGSFYSEELDTRYDFRIIEGGLAGYHPRLGLIRLSPFEVDTFAAPGSGLQKVVFERDEAGRVAGALVSAALAENILFDKAD